MRIDEDRFKPICFVFEGARALSPCRAPVILLGNCMFLLENFKGTKAITRGQGGNRLCCLREVSGLQIV